METQNKITKVPIHRRFIKTTSIATLLLLVGLAGCTTPSSPPATATQPTKSGVPITESELPSVTPASTSFTAKPTLTATALPAIVGTPTVPLELLAYKQLNIEGSLAPGQSLEGAIIFSSEDETYLWEAKSSTVSYFSGHVHELLSDLAVSPDHTRVLFWDGGETIADVHGKVVKSFSAAEPYYWLDNQRIWRPIYTSSKPAYWQAMDTITGRNYKIQQDNFPNDLFNTSFDRPKWDFLALPIYDPGLTRAVYPECQPGCMNSYEQMIVLWDIERKQVLARLTTRDYFGNTPVWSQDGRQFVIALDSHPITTLDTMDQRDELYVISRDGQIRQLTHFTNYFDFLQIPNNYALSPNGQKVAFWMVPQASPYDQGYLAVLDTETGQVINYGIVGFPSERADSISRPIWSPNGSQLLIRSLDPTDGKTIRVIVVDIVHNFASVIANNVLPEAWMTTEP